MAFKATKTPDGRVHLQFERSNENHKLVDAIVVGPAQFEKWSEADIEAIIEARWQAHLEALKPRYDGFMVDEAGHPVLDRNGALIPVWKRDENGAWVFDEAGQPILIEYQRDEAGLLVFGDDGAPVAVVADVEGAE